MEEEFLGSIKLISGEEIVSKILISEEESETILLLDSPVIIETIVIRQMGITTLKIQPWLKYADDSMCIVNMEKVITVTEIRDKEIIDVYEKYLRKKDKLNGETKVTPNMGYLCSISEARKSLEKLYREQ